jgi:hypothetical protein
VGQYVAGTNDPAMRQLTSLLLSQRWHPRSKGRTRYCQSRDGQDRELTIPVWPAAGCGRLAVLILLVVGLMLDSCHSCCGAFPVNGGVLLFRLGVKPIRHSPLEKSSFLPTIPS